MIPLLLFSCKKKEEYPIEPAITFKSFTKIATANGIDNKGILTLTFTDGDGDLGLSQDDTTGNFAPGAEYYYNFFIKYYEKQKGVMTEIVLPFTNNARIPILRNRNKNNAALKGDIAIELFINNPFSAYDTIQYECYIVDRALHKSNAVKTDEIIIDKH
ncbi:MAG: hypothetical protein V2A54_00315 [Bacteroidota bacterium]